MTEDLHHFWIVLISESYEVSNLLQKGAVFEFLAPIVAEKMKKGNKQCLFDTPRTLMVNKEIISEYHKNNCYALS